MRYQDAFGTRKSLQTAAGSFHYFDIGELNRQGLGDVERLPYAIRILLESVLRNVDGDLVTEGDVRRLAGWRPEPGEIDVPLKVARVVLQDFTGVPAVVDLAAMRSAMERFGADPSRINPDIPIDLVIDHSVQVDHFGSVSAIGMNVAREYERNRERYLCLKWAQKALENTRVVPPGAGIIHQVNLEYLARVVMTRDTEDGPVAFPDSLLGTDSHTTMIDGLGVLGWGVGGIEAEAVMLGQPYTMLAPKVVGFELSGALPEGATATDLVLRVTQMLRAHGVVGKFVEFFGSGVTNLALADRATLANMAPEYGATMGFFPVDDETLRYLRGSGRPEGQVDLVERYTKAMGLFRTDAAPRPAYSSALGLDMGSVEPALAGPKRPQDRIPLSQVPRAFHSDLRRAKNERGFGVEEEHVSARATVQRGDLGFGLRHGSVVIAAITSCTNTSNPSVMLGAGLVARKAVEAGLSTMPWVKTSLAPGSKVVSRYLEHAGVVPYLDALGFHTVGYGCTTCIGNSGPLPEDVARAVEEGDLVVTSVLSGNRNFEGRVHALVRGNYLASPMLVVAYALAGRIDIDFAAEPVGHDPSGRPVFLKDIWPSQKEVADAVAGAVRVEHFREEYGKVFDGDERWQDLPAPTGGIYAWDEASTYVREPPFFVDLPLEVPRAQDIRGARVLALLGDSVTTDHISPAGAIPSEGPAGGYLREHGVGPRDFNSFGSRRGNHEVMMRGTFANIRMKNLLLDGVEGGYTAKLPGGGQTTIYEAAMAYQREGTPLVVLAGAEYGTGSSRDWAAKGTFLLGVRAVIARSYERIHRSNLIGMGVLPLEFLPGQSGSDLGLNGRETYDITGIGDDMEPGQHLEVVARTDGGEQIRFQVKARLDIPVEVTFWRNGGILQTVLRRLVRQARG